MKRRLSPAVATFLTALTSILASIVASTAPTMAGDWPQVRGPERDGIAADDALADAWPATGPREVWRRAIGVGFSAIAIVGDRVYTQAADDQHEMVLSLDRDSGDTVWSTTIGTRFTNDFGDGPRSTPTVDGDLVFAISADAQLAALSTRDGSVAWRIDLPERFGAPVPRFGYSGSALVDGELLILEVGGGEGQPAVVALDKKTGELRWGALEGGAGYSSAVVATFGGVRQYLMSRRHRQELVSIDTEGEVLWRHPGARAAIVLPLVIDDDRVFMSSSDDDYGGVLLTIDRDADGTWRVTESWSNHRMRNHFNNAVMVGDHLYGFDNATLRCLDLEDGTIRWAQRGFGKGSLIAAGKRLYVLGDDGTLALASATPEAYTEHGRVRATTGRAWTAPAIADGVVYVRDQDEIVAYDVADARAGHEPATDDRSRAVIERYLAARGGREAWRRVERLSIHGIYSAFSQKHPFTLVRARPDHYRIDFQMLGQAAIRAKDAEGLSMLHPLMRMTEVQRIDSGPLVPQLEREALFGPPLLDASDRGLGVSYRGEGDVDGTPTVVLEVTFPTGTTETWHLDAEGFHEVMIESQVYDFTQSGDPMTQRAYFDDFRAVDGIVMPHHVELEFGARLEIIDIESVEVNGEAPL